jgi:lysophospholipase L1-like esterase
MVLLRGFSPRGQNADKAAAVRAAVASVNARIRQFDDGRNIRYLDLSDKFLQPDKSLAKEVMPDFLHPSAKGYQIWAEGMEPLLSEMMTEATPGAPTTQPANEPAPKFDPITAAPDAKFIERHEQFLQQAKSGSIDLLFLGDSITQGWANNEIWQKFYGPRKAANFGIGGDRTQHVLWRIENGELDGIKPKVVVLLIGTNNAKWNPPAEIATAIGDIARVIRAKTDAKVLLLGVFPRGRDDRDPLRPRIKEINRRISMLDDGENVRYLDFGRKFLENDGVSISRDIMPDALHLSLRGYQIWANAMEPLLKEMLSPPQLSQPAARAQ